MTGKAVAEQLGVDEVIANVMPEDKSRIIDEQKAKHGLVAMVGDGVERCPRPRECRHRDCDGRRHGCGG